MSTSDGCRWSGGEDTNADDSNFIEPGAAGRLAVLIGEIESLRAEAAALGASASVMGPELAVLRSELASLRGAQERQEVLLTAVVGEQTRQAQQQARIIDALGDLLDGTQAIYSLLTMPSAPAEAPEQEGEEPVQENSNGEFPHKDLPSSYSGTRFGRKTGERTRARG